MSRPRSRSTACRPRRSSAPCLRSAGDEPSLLLSNNLTIWPLQGLRRRRHGAEPPARSGAAETSAAHAASAHNAAARPTRTAQPPPRTPLMAREPITGRSSGSITDASPQPAPAIMTWLGNSARPANRFEPAKRLAGGLETGRIRGTGAPRSCDCKGLHPSRREREERHVDVGSAPLAGRPLTPRDYTPKPREPASSQRRTPLNGLTGLSPDQLSRADTDSVRVADLFDQKRSQFLRLVENSKRC